MFPKDRNGSKPTPTRPLAPKLASKNSFVRSPPAAAPRLATSAYPSPSADVGPQPKSTHATTLATTSPRSPVFLRSNDGSISTKSSNGLLDNDTNDMVENGNITPRSKARQSKISNAGSTPRASATKADLNSSATNAGRKPITAFSSPRSLTSKSSPATPTVRNAAKLSNHGGRGIATSRTQISPTPQYQQQQGSKNDDIGASFFHASEMRSQSPPRRPAPPLQSSSFVYANGEQDASQKEIPSRSGSAIADDQNGTKAFSISPQMASVSASTRPTSSASAPVGLQIYNSILNKPASPQKQDLHLTYRKGASQIVAPVEPRMFESESSTQEHKRRQSSLDTVPETLEQTRNPRSISFSTSVASPMSPAVYAAEQTGSMSPGIRGMSISSQPSALGSLVDEDSRDTNAATPGTSSQYTLAAQARQERKVLDLEISNSSLLAINRSLERELRKQKTEVRRFRRLSRNSSKLSWLSDATSPETDNENEDESDDQTLSDRSADDTTDLESVAEEALSPVALEQHDARYRRQDEKRLQLDLTKHKQLLIDSQKMNSSLKRCLGLTEQLIKDGGKALEYQVHVADVELGGRVLSPEEVEMRSEWGKDSAEYFDVKWRTEADRLSAVSQQLLADSDLGTDKDSGVDLDYASRSRASLERDRVFSSTHSDVYSDTAS